MSAKIKKVIKYTAYILVTNILYWCAVYFTHTWLSGYSFLLAYLVNLAFILFGLALDGWMYRFYESEKFIAAMKKEKDIEKSFRMIRLQLDSFVSFKTVLYIFYGLIAVFSQIMDFYPELIGGNVGNFIKANSYSILLLIAFERISAQFARDRQRVGAISEKLERDLTENQE